MAEERYRKLPSFVIDCMPNMREAELRIVLAVVEKTTGWGKEWDRISFSQFGQITGLAKNAINNGIADALERGIIERRKVGNSFEYRLSEPETVDVVDRKTVHVVDQNDAEKTVHLVDQNEQNGSLSRPKTVHVVDTQKTIDIIDTNVSTSPNGKGPVIDDGKKLTEQQRWFGKTCEIVGWDYHTLDKNSSGQIAQTVGVLQKAGYSLDDLCRFGRDVWADDWRWKRHKQHPTLKQLRQEIGKLRANAIDDGEPSSAGMMEL